MKKIIFFLKKIWRLPFHVEDIRKILIENYTHEMLKELKYQDNKRLNKFEFQVFSQNGEDGIIEEIFNRIGSTNKYFIEFGVQDGLETNSTYLLLKNWQGLWLEGNGKWVKQIENNFRPLINSGILKVGHKFIKAENIEEIFETFSVPYEPDLLSIDIDGNDLYVWKAIKKYSPRVVIIEYNAMYPANIKWAIKYDADKFWNGTSHFNASLKMHESLGSSKGYSLVGCNFAGNNAFFVRNDLVNELFQQPYTSENHFEPAKYFLVKKEGHKRGFGEFVNNINNG